MKLIDADKTKENIAKKAVSQHKTKMNWYKDALEVMVLIDSQPAVLLSCPHCHGEGKVMAYEWDKELECVKVSNRKIECDTCHGTGEIGVDDYERIQRKLRESE